MGKIRVLLAVVAAMICPLAMGQTDLRGWNANGQTWLTWTSAKNRAGFSTYDIYVSNQPIKDLSKATLVGRLLPEDWKAERLKMSDRKATWRIPDGKGSYQNLKPDQGLFVYTPHAAVPEYFAVVKHGETGVNIGNTYGPIYQTWSPVQCHPQLRGVTIRGYNYTTYALWVDGREDEDSGRPDFPVMGNAGANGTAHLFTVYEPFGSRAFGLLPASLQFHGGIGSHLDWKPGEIENIDNTVDNGFTVALDDSLWVSQNLTGTPTTIETKTFWFGYWKGYDRFTPPTSNPPEDGLVVDYTLRQIKFIIDWLPTHYPIDRDRISAIGHSMGAGAVSFLTRRYPDLVSAGMAFAHAYDGLPFDPSVVYLLGTKFQNLTTNLPGDLGITDFMKPSTEVPDIGDPSFTRYIWGRNDDTIHWQYLSGADVPTTLTAVDGMGIGQFLYWDERSHSRADWANEYWEGTPRFSAQEMTRHRARLSFPAITAVDHDPAPGIQPNPGTGDPEKGDSVGTWGGYFDWDTDTIADSKTEWGATIFLIGSSPSPHDIAPNPEAAAHITIRKAAFFHPSGGQKLFWTLRRAGDNAVVNYGSFTVPADEVVTVPDLIFRRDPEQRRLTLTYAQDKDADGFDAQMDCEENNKDVWALPGEVTGFSWSTDRTTMNWDLPEPPGGALSTLRYDLIRSVSPDGFSRPADCLEKEGLDRRAVDVLIPAPGSAWFYQVRAGNPCGPGSTGSSSDGTPRQIAPCP